MKEAALVLGGFTCLTLVLSYPLILEFGDPLPSDLGDPLLNAWILAWDSQRLLDGFLGLWQAPIFYPYPDTLAYSEHLLGIAVLVAPVQWLFDNLVLTYNVGFVLSYVLAGSGMYLLVRSLTGQRWAATLAGLAFAFCPYRAMQIPHLQVLMAGWMPVGLWGLHRYHVGGKRAALAVFAVAFLLQGLSNGYYLYFFTLPVAIVGGYSLLRPRRARRRVFLDFGVTALAIAGVLMPVAMVYYEVRQGQGLVRGIDEIVSYSADLASYFHADPALFVWGGWLARGTPEAQLFAGMTLMLLVGATLLTVAGASPAVHALRLEQRTGMPLRTLVGLYAGIALAALLLSLGPEARSWGISFFPVSPYQLAMWLVPGLDGLRVPARLAMVVYLGLSVLAGIGVAAWFPRFSAKFRTVLGLTLAVLILLEGYRGPFPLEELPRARQSFDTVIYNWLADSPAGAVLELPLQARHRNQDTNHTLQYQYRTLEHGHPIINGFSGYQTPLVGFLPVAPAWDPSVTSELLRGLRSIGVRYIIVHEESFYGDRNLARATVEAIRREVDQLEDVVTVGTTHLFQMRDVNWPYVPLEDESDQGFVSVSLDEVESSASHGSASLPLAFDGDSETRWSTGQPQSGSEWLTLEFDSPRSIAKVRLELTGRSWGDYPRVLRIESSVDGLQFDRVLYEDAILSTMITSIPRHQASAVIDLVLPLRRSRAIRLHQLGATDSWFWSIDELSLWERAE